MVIGEPETESSVGTVMATLVTVPVPGAGRVVQAPVPSQYFPAAGVPAKSVGAIALNDGTPDEPFGLARNRFCDSLAHEMAKVPAVVTGLPATVNSAGTVNATDVTVPPPPPPGAAHVASSRQKREVPATSGGAPTIPERAPSPEGVITAAEMLLFTIEIGRVAVSGGGGLGAGVGLGLGVGLGAGA